MHIPSWSVQPEHRFLVETENLYGSRLAFQFVKSPGGEPGRSRNQGGDGLVSEKDCVAGGLGELLDARGDVDRVADQGELEFACAADGPGDHQPGVDPYTDPKLTVGLHAVERGRQRTEVVVLNYRQALVVVTGRHTFGCF